MALILLRVLVLVTAAAAVSDGNTVWATTRASLPCEVAGRERLRPRRPPPPLDDEQPRARTYSWRRDGVDVGADRVSADGTLEARLEDGDGVYQCSVRQNSGIVLGYPVRLGFAHMNGLKAVPRNGTMVAGTSYVLPCLATSDPAAALTWSRNGRVLPNNDRYHSLPTGLVITNVRNEDAGVYKCTATNEVLKVNVSSGDAWLTVEEPRSEQDVRMLPILEEKDAIYSPRGSRVVLPCPFEGWPRRKVTWKLNGEGRPAELEFEGEVLVLQNLQPDVAGEYTCTLQDSGISKKFKVVLVEPPAMTVPPVGKEAIRASTIRFNCTASGLPPPTISWYKDGQPLDFGGRINMKTSTDGKRDELVISGVTSNDAGVYQCFATNPGGVASSWSTLAVTGTSAVAPAAPHCRPEGPRAVNLTWMSPTVGQVVAYTVHTTPIDARPDATSRPGQPHTNTTEVVTLNQALAPYRFQVRVYMKPTASNKNIASDMSESVICQGQGVPFKMAKTSEDSVIVSWKHFASQNPGVLQWILQYRWSEKAGVTNVTLEGTVTNYTITGTHQPLQVRLLGSRVVPWLQQNLKRLPWSNTSSAGQGLDDSEITFMPYDVEIGEVTSRSFVVSWRCKLPDIDAELYTFYACAKNVAKGTEECKQSDKDTALFEKLVPQNEYSVRVRVELRDSHSVGPYSEAVRVTTQPKAPQRFKALSARYINATTLSVTWSGEPASSKCEVRYNPKLQLPVDNWHKVVTDSNGALISGVDPTEKTYIMVTEVETKINSQIEEIAPLYKDPKIKEMKHTYTSSGILVEWRREGEQWEVCHAQNLTWPYEAWTCRQVTQPKVELTTLDPSLPTYVSVSVGARAHRAMPLTIAPRPPDSYTVYLVVGIVVGIIILALLAATAACLWRKRKRSRPPMRARRRNTSENEGNDEERSEMKNVGGRLANGGGSKDADEPLLNGHVHITENPTSKTPNGKLKKGRRYDNAFDVARYDPNATMETVLDPDTSASTTYNLLDTSRRPEYDVSRSSRDASANNSFNKLPDDNMNSELTRSTFELDNSKIQPTLQPNG